MNVFMDVYGQHGVNGIQYLQAAMDLKCHGKGFGITLDSGELGKCLTQKYDPAFI